MVARQIVKARAKRALAALKKRYPDIDTKLEYNSPWELLVATMLAAQCTDARVNTITPEFFRRWPNPASLADADIAEIESVIKSAGFYRNKARNLLACAKKCRDVYGGDVPASMEKLIGLPGVARKTANCVLFGAFGINSGLAVDTHVGRISRRLGLTENDDPVKIERDLMELFPREEWGGVNLRMVQFGRDVCKARCPACAICEIKKYCPSTLA